MNFISVKSKASMCHIIHKNITNGEEQIELEYITECKEKEYYFKAVVKRMNIKDKEKWDEINEHELSLMEVLYDNFCDKSNFDKELMEKTLLGWIELIENPKLYKALKDLTIENQIFISYIILNTLRPVIK